MVSGNSEDEKIREWQKDVVRSIADDSSTAPTAPRDHPPARSSPPPAYSNPSQHRPMVVNQIVTNPPVVVTRLRAPEPKPSDEISAKAMIGTLVGATAGAFIAYAMVKGDSENKQPAKIHERITYRMIEAPVEYDISQPRSITRIPIEDARSQHGSFANGNSGVRTIGPSPTRAETLVPASEHSRHSKHSGGGDLRSYKAPSRGGPIIMIDNEQANERSRASSGRKTVKQQDLTRSPPSAPITEVRTAKEIPLPARSQASRYSKASSATIKDPTRGPPMEPRESLLPSVAPNDSISQVSTRISRNSGRSKPHRSSHHGRSDSRYRNQREYEGERKSKAGSRHKVGDMVDDVIRVVKGTSIKGSERRSVRG